MSTLSSSEEFVSGERELWRTKPTETFVSGDRFRYNYQIHEWIGTIDKPHTVSGWYVCTLDEYAGGVHVLPAENMTLVERKLTDLQKLASRLEEKIEDWIEEVEEPDDELEYAFDQGYIAGLRYAVNLAKEQESL